MAAGLSDPAYSNNQRPHTINHSHRRTHTPAALTLHSYSINPNRTQTYTQLASVHRYCMHTHAHSATTIKHTMWWKIQSYLSGFQACVSVHTWVCLCIFVECREFSYNSLVLYKTFCWGLNLALAQRRNLV